MTSCSSDDDTNGKKYQFHLQFKKNIKNVAREVAQKQDLLSNKMEWEQETTIQPRENTYIADDTGTKRLVLQ